MRRDHDSVWERLGHELTRLVQLVIAMLESVETSTTLRLTIKGQDMANYQLNAGDSVVLTVTDTDAVTGAVVTPDAGSVTAVLDSTTDTLVANADGTFTLTAGAAVGTGNTVTVNATVGGVASVLAVGTYDVVANVVPDATALSITFGTETAPATGAVAPAPAAEATGNFRLS